MLKLTILYAEDDQVTRENYALALKQYFHKVYTAKDGKEALALYYEEKPDVLLLDINMPYVDGLEMLKTIRREDKKTPVAVLTAHSDKEKLLKAIPLGLTGYLVKPVKDALFRETVSSLIAQTETKDIVNLKDGFVWHEVYRELTYRQTPVKLSKKEKHLMTLLLVSIGHYVSLDILISEIWYDEEIDDSHPKKLAQLVYRFNTKLTLLSGDKTQLIENSYALGYRLLDSTMTPHHN